MAAPYWGQLPEPNVARYGSRYSHHYPPPPDFHYSTDAAHRGHSTGQTAAKQPAFGPRLPAASNLAANNMGPRRHPTAAPNPHMHARANTLPATATAAADYDNDDNVRPLPVPPSAPQVSGASPVHYGDDNRLYTYATDALAPSRAQQGDMDAYRRHETRHDAQTAPSQRPIHVSSSRRDGSNTSQDTTNLSRPSLTTSSERQRMFASDRSPLQTLELTLDSMTKEEKRARVQAAEQRARQRAALRASDASGLQAPAHDRHSVDVRNDRRLASKSQAVPPMMPAVPPTAEPLSIREAAATRTSPTPPSERQSHDSMGPPHDALVDQISLAAESPAAAGPGIPQRNLSFRERAAKNTAPLPSDERSPAWSAPGDEALSMASKGNSKMEKEPPGDARYYELREPRLSQAPNRPAAQEVSAKVALLSARNKELPPIPRPSNDTADAHEPGGTRRKHVHNRGSSELSDASRDQPDNRHPYGNFDDLRPGSGLYQPPELLDEWKKGTTGTLSGTLLDLRHEQPSAVDKSKAWWEGGGQGPGDGRAQTQRRAEAFHGEYDTNSPTRFKPPLYLKCGPLLRYCGTRREKFPARTPRGESVMAERETWRGSVMIVTTDAESSYEIAPILRLFVQNVALLPPPPEQVDGELPPEYVDPIAGHPKLGRRGETLHVRPVEHIEEARDVSRDETGNGLFEVTRNRHEDMHADGATELPGSFTRRIESANANGEKMQKYKDVRGFRLHKERGCTFWRFNIEVELRDRQQHIAYRINRGPCMGFWVPARARAMNIMFYSGNGFDAGARPDALSGPDPMWRDVLNTHQTQPFHVMIGGGNQIFNDSVAYDCGLFGDWLETRDLMEKESMPFTPEMQDELEFFYLERYCSWFSQGLFGLATSQIPIVNMHDDHDILNGYGSYAHHEVNGPVFCGLGSVAFRYYMLFQHQSLVTETENSEPSWILGLQPGPYIRELSCSVFLSLGGKVALLAVDCRTERTKNDVVQERTWEKIMNRLYAEIRRGQIEHLLVLSALPLIYPQVDWLENLFASKLMSPVKALGKTGVFGKSPHSVNNQVGMQDDVNGHWVAKNHRHERSLIIEDLQDLAIDKSMRITVLSGNVGMAAVGQFYSNPKLGLVKHRDPRYMPNVISSAMVNAPAAVPMADALSKRNKVHHFDKQTDEAMIPLFQEGIDGRSRSNKHLMPHRSWCSIRQWTPGTTPPPTPTMSARGASRSPSPGPVGGLLRRLSSRGKAKSGHSNTVRESLRGSRPPVSGRMGLFRSLSRRRSTDERRPNMPVRSMSLGRGETEGRDYRETGRQISESRLGQGRVSGQWTSNGAHANDARASVHAGHASNGNRAGGGQDEYAVGDESQFTARPPREAHTVGHGRTGRSEGDTAVMPSFHRTPTGLSARQMRQADKYKVDLEEGLDIRLNIEVNRQDPAGITVPYRMLVPRLQYEYDPAEDDLAEKGRGGERASGLKRLFSFKARAARAKSPDYEDDETSDEDDD